MMQSDSFRTYEMNRICIAIEVNYLRNIQPLRYDVKISLLWSPPNSSILAGPMETETPQKPPEMIIDALENFIEFWVELYHTNFKVVFCEWW